MPPKKKTTVEKIPQKVWRVEHIPPSVATTQTTSIDATSIVVTSPIVSKTEIVEPKEKQNKDNTAVVNSRGKCIILSDCQQKIWDCDKRFIFVQSGRRFGKTTLMQEWLKENARNTPNTTWWYVAPTFKQAKSLMFLPLLVAIPKEEIDWINKQDGDIKLKNGSLIGIRGSDRPDNLRGPRDGLNGVGMEEYSFHKEGVWNLIIRPQLADCKGKALFIGTPSMKKGIDYRDIAEYAKSGTDKEWGYFHFTIYDNPHISKDEIEKIKSSTAENAWTQEYMADFVMEEGPVYYDFKSEIHKDHVRAKWPDVMTYPCVVGLDWGLADDTGIAWVHVLPDGQLAVTKEHSQNNWPVTRHADIIKSEVPKRSNVKAYVLDSTAFKRDSDGTTSVAHEFMKEGVRVLPADRHLDLSIGVVKKFITGDGQRTWLHIDCDCRKILNGLKNWLHGQHEPDIISALRFAIYYIYRNRLSTLVNLDTLSAAKSTNTNQKINTDFGQTKVRLIHPHFNAPAKSMTWGGVKEWNSDIGTWNE